MPQEQIRVVAIEHEFYGGRASALVRFLSGKCLTDDSMIHFTGRKKAGSLPVAVLDQPGADVIDGILIETRVEIL